MVSMVSSKKRWWTVFTMLLLAGLLVYLLWWRWQVSTIRFFDVDEFSYMHWTAQVARGEHMYTDFFSYFTPGFMWFFAPVFWIYGVSAHVFAAGRVLSFVIFLSILGSVSYLWGITRGWKWALLPVVILAVLPMPYDKFLEIRPDNLATLLAIIGVIGEIRGIREKKNIWWLVSGLAYSASLFVLVKTLPVVAVGGGIAVVSAWYDRKSILFFSLGLFGPWILFFLGAAVSGNFGAVWYSLTKLPFEVYKSAANYYMGSSLFFYPNSAFYGGDGTSVTAGLIVNHTLWIVGLVFGAYRLVTPIRAGQRNETFIELLLAGIFVVSAAAYVEFFPLKHSQYLIPIAVFVAYFAADALAGFFDRLEGAGGHTSLAVVLAGCVYLLIVVNKDVNAPKLLFTNAAQMRELTTLIHIIPRTARVVDLEGRMVFWPEGYPISSFAFDTFLPYVSRKPLPLAQYLSLHPAQYIYDGDSNRMATMTAENLRFIQTHFTPVAGLGGRLLKKL
jgi:hypothetical protein